MAKVTAYLCEDTGQLFLEESDYKKHRRQVSAKKRKDAERIESKNKLESYFDNVRKNIKSFEDLALYVETNYFDILKMFVDADKKAVNLDFSFDGGRIKSIIKDAELFLSTNDTLIPYLSFEQRDVVFDNVSSRIAQTFKISNSHDCPRSGVTNWGGRVPDAPRGYPGVNLKFKMFFPEAEGRCFEDGISLIFKYLRIYRGSDEWPFITKEQFFYSLIHGIKDFYLEIKDLVARDFNISESTANNLFLVMDQQNTVDKRKFLDTISSHFKDPLFDSKVEQLLLLPANASLFESAYLQVFNTNTSQEVSIPKITFEC